MSASPKHSADEIASHTKAAAGEHATFPFEAIKLKIGDRLQIQPPPNVSQERAIVRLVGYLNNVSLLVTAPVDDAGLRLQLLENETLVVRIFSAQNAFGFSSTIIKICKSPFDYLHLSFPSEVQGMVIRTAPRVKLRLITSITSEKSGQENTSGVIINLSANGAMLDAKRILAEKGEVIKLSFRINLHGIDSILEIPAIVRAITTSGEDTPGATKLYQHGIQFSNLQPNENMLLQSMIYQQMVEHPDTVI